MRICQTSSAALGGRRDVAAINYRSSPLTSKTPAVVLVVDHDRQPVYLRLHVGRGADVFDDRPGAILLKFLAQTTG
jgi:hypothetical protein